MNINLDDFNLQTRAKLVFTTTAGSFWANKDLGLPDFTKLKNTDSNIILLKNTIKNTFQQAFPEFDKISVDLYSGKLGLKATIILKNNQQKEVFNYEYS